MKVLVDTPIWSYALRSQRTGFELHVDTLKMLIANQRVLIIGAIRQEILSGYSDLGKFNILKHTLSAFHNTLIIDDDYVQAAMFYNRCRQQGIQGSHTDFLICAVAKRLDAQIFTTDKDFELYQKYVPIQLYTM